MFTDIITRIVAFLTSGFGHLETAQVMFKLMKRLGHEKFYVQGGDWGSFIATAMATMYPHRYTQ